VDGLARDAPAHRVGRGALAAGAPLVAALLRLGQIRRSGRRWPEAAALLREFSPASEPALRVIVHDELGTPLTFGARRAFIAFPSGATTWPAVEQQHALLHELEHVRRGDWLTLVIARAICAAYWFHPLVWIAWRRLRLEAEQACDDAVARRCDPLAYADHLVTLARTVSPGRDLLVSMAGGGELAARIRALLDTSRERRPLTTWTRTVTFSVASMLLALFAAVGVASAQAERPRVLPVEAANIGADAIDGGADLDGHLYDPLGRPVPGVVLDIETLWFGPSRTPAGPPFVRATTTDASGYFRFEHIPPSLIGLAAPYTDFVPGTQLVLKRGEHVSYDLRMKLEPAASTFVVCRDCPADSYTLPDSLRTELELDEKDIGEQPVAGPRPLGEWSASASSNIPYPDGLRSTNLEGRVVVEGVVDATGDQINVRVVSASHPELGDAALTLLHDRRWIPANIQGTAIDVPFRDEIDFSLRAPQR
jgi:TonB family protein